MEPEPITEPVLDQLAAVLATGQVDDPNARFEVHGVAREAGYDELATFIVEADAVRYSRALERLAARDESLTGR